MMCDSNCEICFGGQSSQCRYASGPDGVVRVINGRVAPPKAIVAGLVKLLRLQSLDQFKGMDWFRDQFKLEALPMTSQQYL
jgi:hypothetical protein